MKKSKPVTDHYAEIEETITDTDGLALPSGLFILPDNIRGKTDHGIRKFLIFYFDNDDDYNLVLTRLGVTNSKARSHPDLNSKLLANILRKAKE